jgi:hypothetical protein
MPKIAKQAAMSVRVIGGIEANMGILGQRVPHHKPAA